jgi:orotidine-5'-phosphate decarboxylase
VSNPLICALDTADLDELRELAATVGPEVGLLKVGLQAFVAHGRAAVNAAAEHAPVFLDLKLHDIPNTVAGAAAAVEAIGVEMLTVHASGGPRMIEAAVEAAPGVRVLAVTVLTSLDDRDLAAVGQAGAETQVPRLAKVAADAGVAGLVCAPPDVIAVRGAAGPGPALVVPGVRPAGSGADDQSRTGTPRATVESGADYLVVGRPITRAADPAAAARAIRKELA